MSGTCVFCGEAGKLTGEHVFGEWLTRLGLPSEATKTHASPHNRLGRNLGATKPFTMTVREVCAPCNNGWMSRLERVSQRALSPLIRGEPGSISNEDVGLVAAWAHKTVLMNMMITPEAARARGDNVFADEYHAVYEARDQSSPVGRTRFWIGRYEGSRLSAAWLTPMTVGLSGEPVPDVPQAYVMTLVIGALVLQGIRFTTPLLEFDLENPGFETLWPRNGPVDWPPAASLDDERFLKACDGFYLSPRGLPVRVKPWVPAMDLPRSEMEGDLVRLPALCGKHDLYYPARLMHEGIRGVSHAFVATCACRASYLIVTWRGGAKCRSACLEVPAEGDPTVKEYQALPGEEIVLESSSGTFVCKRLPPGM